MKAKKSNKLFSNGKQAEKPHKPGQQKKDQDPKQFEERRSKNIRMKPQPYKDPKKK